MQLQIRTARNDDRRPIAELMYSAGPDVYDFLYGPRALDFLRFEFASGVGFAGYANVTVALLDGEVVGTGCFYDRARFRDLKRGTGKNLFACFGPLRAVPVLLRSRHMSSVMRAPRPGELYLANFGVAAQLRSRGVGSRLLQHKIEEARRQGYRIFGLDVSVANPRGQALYTRFGLQPKQDKPFSAKNAGVHSARKMELVL